MSAYTDDIGRRAKAASAALASAGSGEKNAALSAAAEALRKNAKEIIAANEADLENAAGKVPDAMLDRLRLDETRRRSRTWPRCRTPWAGSFPARSAPTGSR